MTSLTKTQYAEIAENLRAQRHQLLDQIRQHIRESGRESAIDMEAQLNDNGDLSVADLVRDMELERLDRETEQLRDVEAAEVRMQKRTYGVCIDCDDEIRPERLHVQPTASRCIQCQALYERTHATRALGHA